MKNACKGRDYSAKGKGRRVWLRLCRRMVRKSRPPKGGRRCEFNTRAGLLTNGKGSKKQTDGKEEARPTLQTTRANRFGMLCHNVDTLQRAAVHLVQTVPRYERLRRPRPFQATKYARLC